MWLCWIKSYFSNDWDMLAYPDWQRILPRYQALLETGRLIGTRGVGLVPMDVWLLAAVRVAS